MMTVFSKRKSRLTSDEKAFWEENGYLVLSGFFRPKEVEAVNRLVRERMGNPRLFGNATVDVLHGENLGRRFRGREVPQGGFDGPIKINDLFLDEPAVRHLALNENLTSILSELLDGAPMVCNSLNFIWGSQQPDHFDTWYMPPIVENKLAVSSIALEDVRPDAGPLVYYPGSHKIAPYRFSHGGIHAVDSEMDACRAYLRQQLEAGKFERKNFLGKAGDVFLWHGQLLHGGTGINDLAKTRKTLVTHYWRACDVEPERAVKVHKTGYYLKRDHQATAG